MREDAKNGNSDNPPPETVWPYRYATGELIMPGDRVIWADTPAIVVELVSPTDPRRADKLLESGGVEWITSGARLNGEYDEIELEHFKFVMRSGEDPQKQWQKDWKSPGVGMLEDPDSWRQY